MRLRTWIIVGIIVAAVTTAHCRRGPARFNDGFCSIGTEELNTAFDHWTKRYADAADLETPPVHEGRGNATAPGALRDGVCDFAPMTRPMTDAEIDAFVRTFGAKPVAVPVAVEGLAVIVPQSSLLKDIELAELRRIYAEAPHSLIDVFPEVEGGPHENRPLEVFGQNTASDRYRWFKATVLAEGGEFSDRVLEVPGPLELVDRVAATGPAYSHGFGYARPAELTDGVIALPLRKSAESAALAPTEENLTSGRYALARYYYVYLPPPGTPKRPNPRALSFLEFILAPESQQLLRPLGLYPLSAQDREASLKLLRDYVRRSDS